MFHFLRNSLYISFVFVTLSKTMVNKKFIESISLPEEVWKDLKGYEGKYKISSLGRVVSLRRPIDSGNGLYYKDPFLLKQSLLKVKKLTYKIVTLYKDGKYKKKTVHRLVAEAFLDNPNGYPYIDHINRNGEDNTVSNLRWATQKMNMSNENTKKILATAHPHTSNIHRYRPVAKMLNGKIVASYISIVEATKEGYAQSGISHVCRGDRKTYKGFEWCYLD